MVGLHKFLSIINESLLFSHDFLLWRVLAGNVKFTPFAYPQNFAMIGIRFKQCLQVLSPQN